MIETNGNKRTTIPTEGKLLCEAGLTDSDGEDLAPACA
jgi:hypothetical protein